MTVSINKKRARDPFKKLHGNIKSNGVSPDANGVFNKINSSTNRKRMAGEGKMMGSNPNSKPWIPAKIIITPDELREIWNKQDGKCYWMDQRMDIWLLYDDHPEWYQKHPLAPSVDRIDDDKDYTKDNIVLCYRGINFARNVYPFDKFHDVIKVFKGQMPNNVSQLF